jgi:hypothetical protein
MGQYWFFLNIDKRERYDHWGKLGEFLFSDCPYCPFFNLHRISIEFSSGDEAVTDFECVDRFLALFTKSNKLICADQPEIFVFSTIPGRDRSPDFR